MGLGRVECDFIGQALSHLDPSVRLVAKNVPLVEHLLLTLLAIDACSLCELPALELAGHFHVVVARLLVEHLVVRHHPLVLAILPRLKDEYLPVSKLALARFGLLLLLDDLVDFGSHVGGL